MFGIASRLLAVLALALVTTWLVNQGRGRNAPVTVIPMLFVTSTTLTAAKLLITGRFAMLIHDGRARIDAGDIEVGQKLLVTGYLNTGLTIFVVACVCVRAGVRSPLDRRGARGAAAKARGDCMTGYAKSAIAVSLIAAAAEVALAMAVVPAWSPGGVNPIFLVFLAGPLVFLALVAWRRRERPSTSKLLFRLALLLAVPAVLLLLNDYLRFRIEPPGEHAPHARPLVVPLVQWIVLLVVWAVLVIREGRAKRAQEAAEKKA